MHSNALRQYVKAAFDSYAQSASDNRGYVQNPEANLLPGIKLAQFKKDLDEGAGNELRAKFCAVHSSSALAVNTFALFKDKPEDLVLLGRSTFAPPSFEKTLPSGLDGTPPTLDVFLRSGDEAVAIESKFLEYFSPKQAKFAHSYNRLQSHVDAHWWTVYQHASGSKASYLDVAQLVKHSFGISHLLAEGDETGWKPTRATLLYLFWEPDNALDVDICRQHRKEVEELAAMVKGSSVVFRWLSHPELWQEWSFVPALREHAGYLRRRYSIKLPAEKPRDE